ncbi:TatD family deoxyribonuclease, partial [bacterium]|nr:TatD family deoxyribonuclease [bacterium]
LIVSYPKNTQLHEVYKLCPLENLLIETDAPFLPPQSKRGKTCYPHYLEFFQALM